MNIYDAADDLVRKPIKMVTAKQNADTMARLMRDWNLGPEKASVEIGANKPYWSKLAKVWKVPEAQARRQLCANCEYFENTPEMMEAMEAVPLTAVDMDGGGRGYCHKFDFICHNLRTCQAWEYKEYEGGD
jgi:hypothetical protein